MVPVLRLNRRLLIAEKETLTVKNDPDPNVRAINANFCANWDALLAANVFYDGQNGPAVKALSQAAQAAPSAPNVSLVFLRG